MILLVRVDYDASARIPLIFHGPGIPSGRRVGANVSHIDLLPTLLHYANMARPQSYDPNGRPMNADAEFGDARSLMDAFGEENLLDDKRVFFSESGLHGLHFMLKQGSMKYNFYPDTEEIECYDLEQDPQELTNLGPDMVYGDLPVEVREKLRDILQRAHRHGDGYYYAARKLQRIFT